MSTEAELRRTAEHILSTTDDDNAFAFRALLQVLERKGVLTEAEVRATAATLRAATVDYWLTDEESRAILRQRVAKRNLKSFLAALRGH
jgi:hypothetical protein